MSKASLEVWIQARTPEIPAVFLPYVLRDGGDALDSKGGSTSEELSTLGTEAIRRALKRPGRNRDAAFQLLVAAALLTYACEAMTREGDASAGLERLLQLLGDRFHP